MSKEELRNLINTKFNQMRIENKSLKNKKLKCEKSYKKQCE